MQKRELWGSRAGFILAAVGSAIGLGNIWRFPYMTYENGGGAFFIPYLFAMLTAGIPFMIMEFGLGHKTRHAAPAALASLNRRFEWLGWFQVLMAAVIAIYYVAVISWAISYLYFAFGQAWGDDPNNFFFTEYLGLQKDSSPSNLGSVQWHIAVPLAIAWFTTFTATFFGIKSGIERINKVLMPALFIMILLLIIRVLSLDGSMNGINWMFKPDFSKITDPKVWSAAYGQIFFTLSVGFAIMIGYSSYLPKKSDINNNAFMTVLINCGFSILAGIVIFGALGFMAQNQGKELTDVVSSGVGLAFVTIPAAINEMPTPWLFGPVFFLALVFAGISSHISITEACTSSLMDKLGWSRHKAAVIFCGSGFLISGLFVTNGGLLLLDLIDHFLTHIALLASCFLELILVAWLFKMSELHKHINKVSEFSIGHWWTICIKFISPAILAILVLMNIRHELAENYSGYADNEIIYLGWGMVAILLLMAIAISTNYSNKLERNKSFVIILTMLALAYGLTMGQAVFWFVLGISVTWGGAAFCIKKAMASHQKFSGDASEDEASKS